MSQKVQEYKDSLKMKAEELILEGFPETILKLNEILETSQVLNRKLVNIRQELNIPVPDPIQKNSSNDLPPAKKAKYDNSISQNGTKGYLLPSGRVTSNKNLLELIDVVKLYLRKLVEESNLLRMWISFMIPKVEDGNNFGVSIQENTLAEVKSVVSEAAVYLSQIPQYFSARSKLISKMVKHPYIDDYRRAIHEMDEETFFTLRYIMGFIRNRYCFLHDLIVKNLEKINKPRSSNAAESLY